MKKILLLLLISSSAIITNAQGTLAETFKAQMIKDWERAKAYTNEYLTAMPADKYSFKAQDSIRSFAQQMLHLAQANTNLSSNATGATRPWQRRLEVIPGTQTKDSVVYFVNASYDFVLDGIKKMDATKLEEKVKAGTLEETKLAWLLKAFEHQTHHRGQTTIYIRLVGIKPPNEKLF
ncbi:MAG: DinB family protein [Saprospiraceae bacterium]